MKITVLQNFGLGEVNLEAGQVLDVQEGAFGDNIASFEGVFFEKFEEPKLAPPAVATSALPPSVAPPAAAAPVQSPAAAPATAVASAVPPTVTPTLPKPETPIGGGQP